MQSRSHNHIQFYVCLNAFTKQLIYEVATYVTCKLTSLLFVVTYSLRVVAMITMSFSNFSALWNIHNTQFYKYSYEIFLSHVLILSRDDNKQNSFFLIIFIPIHKMKVINRRLIELINEFTS